MHMFVYASQYTTIEPAEYTVRINSARNVQTRVVHVSSAGRNIAAFAACTSTDWKTVYIYMCVRGRDFVGVFVQRQSHFYSYKL